MTLELIFKGDNNKTVHKTIIHNQSSSPKEGERVIYGKYRGITGFVEKDYTDRLNIRVKVTIKI